MTLLQLEPGLLSLSLTQVTVGVPPQLSEALPPAKSCAGTAL